MIFCIRDQFDQPIFLVFQQLEALLPKALKGGDVSPGLEFVTEKHGDGVNVNDLIVELNILKALLKIKVYNPFTI